ncbi:MAG: hypothetical protein JW863_12395 [Chitinispirillaceae bacterium]|nr:hypothetical protein [Chitinispirillaceae bacterium]
MNNSILLIAATIALIGSGCAEFPTSYSRIEPDKPRLLDFIYEPAEAAPGDTVLLKAVFAGRDVSPEDLTWEVSWNIRVNEYGVNTAPDTVPLEITPVAYTFSDRTSCIAFTFVIPDHIIENSSAVPDNWTAAIPEYYREAISEEYRSFSKKEFLQMIDLISASASIAPESIDEEFRQFLPLLLQCFTAPMQIYCRVDGGHEIVSSYSVRYNSRFASVPQLTIPVNHNPMIDSLCIYAVEKKPLMFFNPATCNYPFTRMPVSGDTVQLKVDEEKSYFIGTFTGNVDTSLSIDATLGNGSPLPEQHLTQWYLEFDQEELDDVAPSELMLITNDDFAAGQHISHLYPSLDHAITGCTAWIEVRDAFLNELYRPQGSMLRELVFRFEYEE